MIVCGHRIGNGQGLGHRQDRVYPWPNVAPQYVLQAAIHGLGTGSVQAVLEGLRLATMAALRMC
jgi:hypothetical protein